MALADATSVLVGMHPTFTQVPPGFAGLDQGDARPHRRSAIGGAEPAHARADDRQVIMIHLPCLRGAQKF